MGVKDIATEHSLKTKEVSLVFESLAAIAAKEVKKTGVFTIPGLCRIKTRVKPATQDRGQGFPSGCIEEADLEEFVDSTMNIFSGSSRGRCVCGNPTGRAWK